MTFLLQLLFGHLLFAFAFYGTHRWVLHGFLGKIGPLKSLKKQHANHHKSPQDPGGLLFTKDMNALLLGCCSALSFLYPPIGIGAFLYLGLYTWRHRRAHSGAKDPTALHHLSHHYKSARKNFDIVYPLIDKLLKTKAD